MNAEITLLAASVTKLELQVRTRFLKLMLSTQNTDKFVSLVDQYLNRFPLSFQFPEPTIPPQPAKPSGPSQKNKDTSVSQQSPAKPLTTPKNTEENTDSAKESQPIIKIRKLTATERRTIRRSLPVFVKAALGKTKSPQRMDFLTRLEINPIKALSRSKNSAIIFKHPRLGDISAGAIRTSFANIETSDTTKSKDTSKTPPKSQATESDSLFQRDVTPSPTPSATSVSFEEFMANPTIRYMHSEEPLPQSTLPADISNLDESASTILKSEEPSTLSKQTTPISKPSSGLKHLETSTSTTAKSGLVIPVSSTKSSAASPTGLPPGVDPEAYMEFNPNSPRNVQRREQVMADFRKRNPESVVAEKPVSKPASSKKASKKK